MEAVAAEVEAKGVKAIAFQGDVADENLLSEEAIETSDVYCVLTNDDEANILSSMLAKRLGVPKVITIINRPAYVDLVEDNAIDIAVSPQQVTIGALLTHIRRGNMVRIHSLRGGAAEAIEAVALGDERSSRVAKINTVIAEHDHVLLFVADKDEIPAVEQLFQVRPSFV